MKRLATLLVMGLSHCALPVKIEKPELSPNALELAIQQQAAIQTDVIKALNQLIADLREKGILVDKSADAKTSKP